MNKNQVKQAVMSGNLIDCTQEEYQNFVRRYLQEFAGESIDNNQIIYTTISLSEVKRLDEKFEAAEQNAGADSAIACPTCGGRGTTKDNRGEFEICYPCAGSGQSQKLAEQHS